MPRHHKPSNDLQIFHIFEMICIMKQMNAQTNTHAHSLGFPPLPYHGKPPVARTYVPPQILLTKRTTNLPHLHNLPLILRPLQDNGS